MRENRKERRVRFLLLFICISFTIGALYYKNNIEKKIIQKTIMPPLVSVLHQSIQKNDNPIVILTKKHEQKYILAEYEIKLDENYRFKTKRAVTINGKPEMLSNDKSRNGIWVKINGDWLYFTSDFEQTKRSPENREHISTEEKFSIVEKKTKKTIVRTRDIQFELEAGQTVDEIYSLATDGSLWLVTTDHGVIISMAQNGN